MFLLRRLAGKELTFDANVCNIGKKDEQRLPRFSTSGDVSETRMSS